MPGRIRSFALAALFLAACQGIPVTEPTWSREELEVEVEVDPQIGKVLQEETDIAALQQVVSEAVLELADVGLRFYPVSSTAYEEGQPRPEYLLSVQVQDIGARLEEKVPSAVEITISGSKIDSVRCTVVATLVKRRGEGPALIVGKSVGHGSANVREAAVDLSSMQDFALQSPDRYVLPPRLSAADLRASIREAVSESLRQLIEPIEREHLKD